MDRALCLCSRGRVSPAGGRVGNPVKCMELNNYERNLPPAKLLLADDAIAAACAEIIIIIIVIIIIIIIIIIITKSLFINR